MDLREYMFRNRLTNKAMAEMLGCSCPHITLLKRGGRPGKWLAKVIEEKTGGLVKAEELRKKCAEPEMITEII